MDTQPLTDALTALKAQCAEPANNPPMDTRKLEILKNDQTTMLSLVEPGAGGEVIARIDPATVHSEPLREVRRRYNAYPEILAAMEGLLAQLDGPVMVHGDGRGRDGTKTGLSGQEFNTLRDNRLAAARALLTSLNA